MLEDLQQNVIYLRNHYLMALIGIGGWDLPLGDLIILLSQGVDDQLSTVWNTLAQHIADEALAEKTLLVAPQFLRADQLGAALDANSQAITNINVDSGAIDGTVIGAAYGGTGQDFSASSGAISVSSGTFSAGTLSVPNGGTGATSLTDGGVLLGSGTGAITATAQPTDGQHK